MDFQHAILNICNTEHGCKCESIQFLNLRRSCIIIRLPLPYWNFFLPKCFLSFPLILPLLINCPQFCLYCLPSFLISLLLHGVVFRLIAWLVTHYISFFTFNVSLNESLFPPFLSRPSLSSLSFALISFFIFCINVIGFLFS